MKRNIINILATLALIAGLTIGAACQGILAFLGAFVLAFVGAVTLISGNTDWIWKA